MRPDDLKMLASGYQDGLFEDGSFDAEDRELFEQEMKEHPEVLAHLEEIRRLGASVRGAATAAAMPNSLEFNWQRVKARYRAGEGRAPWWAAWFDAPAAQWTAQGAGALAAAAACLLLLARLAPGRAVEVETVSSPEPGISATAFSADHGQVIWLTGLEYRLADAEVR